MPDRQHGDAHPTRSSHSASSLIVSRCRCLAMSEVYRADLSFCPSQTTGELIAWYPERTLID
jgi:hypothetical protein